MNQLSDEKRGELVGAAVTDEVLLSSRTVTQSARGGEARKGLQQHFTPPGLSEIAVKVFGTRGTAFDPTAGNGALLGAFPRRAGVEIDADQIHNARALRRPYDAIRADLQHAYPLLRMAGVKFDTLVANPPFGLRWRFGAVEMSSLLATWKMCESLVSPLGGGVFVGGTNRLMQEVWPDLKKKAVAIIEGDDWFEGGVRMPSSAVFWDVHGRRRYGKPDNELLRLTMHKADLEDGVRVEKAWRQIRELVSYPGFGSNVLDHELWEDIRKEYDRRLKIRLGKVTATHTISIRSKRIHVYVSAIETMGLKEHTGWQAVSRLKTFSKQAPAYFGLNKRDLRWIWELEGEQLISISDEAKKAIAKAVEEAAITSSPLYPIRPQQRFGFLEGGEYVRCTKADSEKGYVEGEEYLTACSTRVVESRETRSVETKDGPDIREFKVKRRALQIWVGNHDFGEDKEGIEYLLEHFDIPDPGCVMDKFPERVREYKTLLRSIAREFGFSFRDFQVEDLARVLFKKGGVLAWDQGLGKSVGGLGYAEAMYLLHGAKATLFIVPQDLVPQWQREARKFFNRRMEKIDSIAKAKEVAKRVKAGEEGWFITWYEALSRNGRKLEMRDDFTVYRTVHEEVYVEDQGWYAPKKITKKKRLVAMMSDDICPQCRSDDTNGWNGTKRSCEGEMEVEYFHDGEVKTRTRPCGYTMKSMELKPAYSFLTTAFKTGCIVVDEGTKIKGANSLMSKAVRALRSKHKLLMTGTPIKNYVVDLFYLLGWALGWNSPRFPYDYDGRERFIDDFAVTEQKIGKPGKSDGNRKVLPEVTNLSMLWRILSASIVRRRAEDCGEPIVSLNWVEEEVPFGVRQREMYLKWLDSENFKKHFLRKHPDTEIPESMITLMAAMLGQLWKLDFTATAPGEEPDGDYTPPGMTNWTPKNLRVLELAKRHADAGDKVVVFSNLVSIGPWFSKELRKVGIEAVHITEVDAKGKTRTKAPKKRAGEVYEFQQGTAQVLCAGIQALNLGHNLDRGSVVILNGFPWDASTVDQGIKRVRRLTSVKDVTIYVVMAKGSIDTEKWGLLRDKQDASDLAIDGELFDRKETKIDLQKQLRKMQKRGLPLTGEEISEDECLRLWREKTRIIALPPPALSARTTGPQLSLFGLMGATK